MEHTLEYELAQVMVDARLLGRQGRAVSRRVGFDGHGPTTLAAAGGAEGYTRERVRQLERRLHDHFATGVDLPLTQAALRVVELSAPAPRIDIAHAISAAGIAARPFDPAGVICAAALAGIAVDVRELDGLVVHKDRAADPERAVSLARALVSRHGATSIAVLTHKLGSTGLTASTIRRLLEHHGDVTWLDEKQEWLVVPVRGGRAAAGLRKMLSIARSLTVADVDEGLRRSARPVTLPRGILRAMCTTFDWISLDRLSDVVTSKIPLDPARTLSPLERELVRIFRTDGPELAFGRAVELAADAGINPTSAGLYLGRTPVLRTVSRGRYAVRGTVFA